MNFRPKISAKPMERRRHARVKLALLGRYMLEDRREFPCQTNDVSVGGLSLTAPVRGVLGERVVAYFDALGRVEGTIIRHIDFGFVMTANMPASKREKLVNQLTWLANRKTLGLPEDRRHERIVPTDFQHHTALPRRQHGAGEDRRHFGVRRGGVLHLPGADGIDGAYRPSPGAGGARVRARPGAGIRAAALLRRV